MNAKSRDTESTRLAERAVQWLQCLESADAAQKLAFAKWLTESRRNVEAFLFATAIEQAMEGPEAMRSIDVEALLARSGTNVIPLDPTPASWQGQNSRIDDRVAGASATATKGGRRKVSKLAGTWKRAAGLAAVAVAASAWWALSPDGADTFTTGVGEQRTVRLADGSLLQLNTSSQVRVAFTKHGRDLHLSYGEALFGAERDPARPFRVHAGGTIVQAIGTRFNVYHRQDTTTVAVLEGIVQISPGEALPPAVSPIRLAAGRKAQIAETGRVLKLETADTSRSVAWRQRRLMFDRDTLSEIAEQFNRYNVSPRIAVDGAIARERRYTGIFDADDPSSLLEYLARDRSLAIERHDAHIVIRDAR